MLKEQDRLKLECVMHLHEADIQALHLLYGPLIGDDALLLYGQLYALHHMPFKIKRQKLDTRRGDGIEKKVQIIQRAVFTNEEYNSQGFSFFLKRRKLSNSFMKALSTINFTLRIAFIVCHNFGYTVHSFSLKPGKSFISFFISLSSNRQLHLSALLLSADFSEPFLHFRNMRMT